MRRWLLVAVCCLACLVVVARCDDDDDDDEKETTTAASNPLSLENIFKQLQNAFANVSDMSLNLTIKQARNLYKIN